MAKKDKLTTNDPQNATRKTTNITSCTQQNGGQLRCSRNGKQFSTCLTVRIEFVPP